jgi:hypothetical protein
MDKTQVMLDMGLDIRMELPLVQAVNYAQKRVRVLETLVEGFGISSKADRQETRDDEEARGRSPVADRTGQLSRFASLSRITDLQFRSAVNAVSGDGAQTSGL